MDLNELLVFARVIQAGSFTAAASALGMPKSTVSRRVLELETRLGARLLHRTTRTLHLTEVGRAYYDHAIRAVAEAEEAERAVTHLQDVPRGVLRVTAPLNLHYLGPMVTSYLQRYPEMELELVCTDCLVDLVHEGFDVAVRAGPLADSTLVVRRLGTLHNYVVAAPDYTARAPLLRVPSDLAAHPCVVFGAGSERSRWRLERDDELHVVDVTGRLTVNDFDVVLQATLAGLGLSMLPHYLCLGGLRSGRLCHVLPGWRSPHIALHAVYPSARHLSPKVKSFLDHLTASMTPPPWELGPPPVTPSRTPPA